MSHWKPLFSAVALVVFASPAVWAQDPLESELSVAAIQSRIAAVAASPKLDATAKAAATKQLEEAKGLVGQASKARASADELERLGKAAPTQLKQNQKELAQPAKQPEPEAPPGASLSDLERGRGAAEANLKSLRDELEALKKESADRVAFLAGASEAISTTASQLAAVEESLKGSKPPKGLAEAAGRLLALAKRRALTEELRRLKAEQASYLARRELLQSRLDLLGRKIRSAEGLVTAWLELESARRSKDIAERERAAKKAAENELVQRLPALDRLVSRITDLGEESKKLAPELKQALRAKTTVEKRLADLREQFGVTRRKVETAGITQALGLVLRRQLAQLPDPDRLGTRLSQRQEQIAETQYRLITLEEERAKPSVADLDLGLKRIMSMVPASLTAEERREVRQIATRQLKARRESLDALKADLESHLQNQVDLDLAARKLTQASREYRAFLREQILWVPSVARGARVSGAAALASLDWLFRAPQWAVTWVRVWEDSHLRVGVLLLAMALLVLVRPRARRGLQHSGDKAWKLPAASLLQTVRATVYTLLLAAPLPLAAWGLGTILAQSEAPTRVALAFGSGLRDVGLTWFVLELVRQSLRSQGLGPSHFRWPSTATSLVRFHVNWLLPVLLVTTLISTALDTRDFPAWNESLGRGAFLVEMLALSGFAWRVLRPQGALMARLLQRHAQGWLHRLRWVWYPLAIGTPIAFGVLATRGYYYTAQQLEGRLQWTLVLLLGLGYLEALLERWLRLAKLRIVSKPAEDLSASSILLSSAQGGRAPNGLFIDPGSGAVDRTATAEIPTPGADVAEDLTSSRDQTQRLFRALLILILLIGLFLIWASHLPALRRLERVQVWPNPGQILKAEKVRYPTLEGTAVEAAPAQKAGKAEETAAAAGDAPALTPSPTPATPSAEKPPNGEEGILSKPLSLAGLLLAVALIGFMLVAAQNLPGLVDIILSQRSNLDAGARFAASAVLRYLILAIGIGAALSTLGLRWGSVQWLVAALTFGLAFGLQEIFANFVSGLIILFERPIRIGDWVTIGDVSGIVTRIRIRATTVTDWDRKDLIIPNKNFVTGNIVNWALSDAVMRIQIPVGVAYGSDVALVRRTLLEIAEGHPDVLATPEPNVLFQAFGDSSLAFELRGFVAHPSLGVPTRNEIFDRVDRTFRERGIEIAFPQRDLHLRTVYPGFPGPREPRAAPKPPPSTDDAGT